MEILIILFLTMINGLLAMSEMAIVSARKARLQQQADEGSSAAQVALDLSNNPNRFLSTVQIGITLIGILAGAFGGATLADDVGGLIDNISFLAAYSQEIGFALIVLLTTYLSLVIGELVPKRLAIQNPERIALLVAPLMRILSRVTYPLVWLLSASTEALLFLLGMRDGTNAGVTEEEIHVLLREGAEAGVFDESEQEMVAGVFRLDTLRAEALMTPRTGLIWFDVNDTLEVVRHKLTGNQYSRFPVCEGSLDNVIGIVAARDLLIALLNDQPLDLRALAKPALFIPQTATASDTLDMFRGQERTAAMVIGEYGGVEGIITVTDIMEAIVGDIEEPEIVQRDDGSWLIDGLMPVDEFRDMVDLREQFPGEEENLYQTLAGFILTHQGHIPRTGEHFEWRHFYFEVVDMDGNRIDKVLVRRLEIPAPPGDKRTTGEITPAKSAPDA